MGEGWGEGVYDIISITYVPLPLIPSHQGRGNPTFYECIKIKNSKLRIAFISLHLAPFTLHLDPCTLHLLPFTLILYFHPFL